MYERQSFQQMVVEPYPQMLTDHRLTPKRQGYKISKMKHRRKSS